MITAKRRTMLVVLIIGSLILSTVAMAEPKGDKKGPRAGHEGKPGAGKMLQEKLGLTDEQVQKMEALRAEGKEKMAAASKTVKEKQEALQEAVKAGAKEADIRAAATQVGAAIGDRAVLEAANVAELKKILTKEQYEKMQEMRKSGPKNRGERPERGERRGRGGRRGKGPRPEPEDE